MLKSEKAPSPVAPALLARFVALAATSADLDLPLFGPPMGVAAAAADLGRADRDEAERSDADATAIAAISEDQSQNLSIRLESLFWIRIRAVARS